MTSQKIHRAPDGSPLAVCLNDCEIDGGQLKEELAPVCFRLGCAFAEMRWGRAVYQIERAPVAILRQSPAAREGFRSDCKCV